jgi:F0F1-type ATP synthase, delta subunit (mitochondrial oligomycin sensitivity protein)
MSLDKTTIAKRYSKALFDVVAEQNQIDQVRDELKQIQQIFDDNEGLGKMLTDKGLKDDQKRSIWRF